MTNDQCPIFKRAICAAQPLLIGHWSLGRRSLPVQPVRLGVGCHNSVMAGTSGRGPQHAVLYNKDGQKAEKPAERRNFPKEFVMASGLV